MQTETFKELPPRQVRRFLEERGIRVTWLAEKTGIHRTQLHHWFAGTEGLPIASQRKVADALSFVATGLPESIAS